MREEIEERPAAILLSGLILGLIVVAFPIVLLGLAGIGFWLRPMRGKLLLAGAFIIGLAVSLSNVPSIKSATPVHGVGLVSSVPQLFPTYQSCEVRIEGLVALTSLPRDPSVMLGDRIQCDGIGKPMQSTVGAEDRFRDVQITLQLDRVEVVGEGPWIAHVANVWRRSFIAFFDRNLSSKDSALVDALCFNARSMVDPQTKAELTQSGMIHILSASGLQVFVFGALISMALRFFPVPRWVQILMLACVLTLYGFAAGLQPQIVRAAAMTTVGLSAYIFKRDPDALSAVALSGFLYLLCKPEAVFGMSFQLSMVTIVGLSLFFQRTRVQPVGLRHDLLRVTNEFFRVNAIVLLSTAPLVAYYLGKFSVVSIFANVLVCWALPLLVGLSFCTHAMSFSLPLVADVEAERFISPLTHWIYLVVDGAARAPGAFEVPQFSAFWLIAYYGAWALTYRRRVVQP